jgi:hypothetical protein
MMMLLIFVVVCLAVFLDLCVRAPELPWHD